VRGVAIDSEESGRAPARSETLGAPSSRWRSRRPAPLICLVALAVTASAPAALAAEPLSGYGGTTPAPATTPSPTPPPAAPHEQPRPKPPTPEGTKSEEVTRPEEKDERGGVAATVAAKPASPARVLPFTGRDVRTELAVGLLLIAGGCALLLVQRRGMSARRFRHTRIARGR
jgi:hypothetical protein